MKTSSDLFGPVKCGELGQYGNGDRGKNNGDKGNTTIWRLRTEGISGKRRRGNTE